MRKGVLEFGTLGKPSSFTYDERWESASHKRGEIAAGCFGALMCVCVCTSGRWGHAIPRRTRGATPLPPPLPTSITFDLNRPWDLVIWGNTMQIRFSEPSLNFFLFRVIVKVFPSLFAAPFVNKTRYVCELGEDTLYGILALTPFPRSCFLYSAKVNTHSFWKIMLSAKIEDIFGVECSSCWLNISSYAGVLSKQFRNYCPE